VATEESKARQEATNAKARREISRACGVSLLGISAILDGGADVDKGVDPTGLALLALGARGRRLLRSAYRLLDVGERSEAAILFRVLQEYLITSRWLLLDDEHMNVWALDDQRRRAVTIEQVASDPDLDEETKKLIVGQAEEARAKYEEFLGAKFKDDEEEVEVCPECKRPLKKKKRPSLPSVEQMAKETDLKFAYDLGYRLSSQADLHATPLVVDYTLQEENGTISVREEPLFSLGHFDSYAIGAHLLLDLLRPISDRWPDLQWGPHFDAVQTTLEAVRAADPDSQSYKDKAVAKSELAEQT